MSKQRIMIADADKNQLRAFALELGIPTLPTSYNREHTLNRIRQQGYTEDFIEIEIDPGTGNPALTREKVNVAAVAEGIPLVDIEIQVSEAEHGSDPVYVSVNGRGMLIPRGERVSIPAHFREALKNAVADVYDPLKDGGISTTPRKVPRFPHQYFGLTEKAA